MKTKGDRPPSFLKRAEAVQFVDLPGVQKAVLMWLAFRAGDSWPRCWPTVETLVNDTGFSRGAVRRALTALATAGHITSKRRWKGRNQTSNEYRLVTIESMLTEGVRRGTLRGSGEDPPGAGESPKPRREPRMVEPTGSLQDPDLDRIPWLEDMT